MLAVAAAGAAATVWRLVVSPRRGSGAMGLRLVFEIVVFGAAVVTRLAVDRETRAYAFAAVAVVDGLLVRVLDA